MTRLSVVARLACGFVLALGTSLGAQNAAPRRVEGRVVVQRDSAEAPVAGEWVTLHRVGADTSGPLDSVRTGARGEYAISYRPFGASDAIYFVSTRYGGVAYFTRPLRDARVTGDDARIDVFDTTSAPVRATIRGRHLIVSGPDAAGARSVIEVFELSNDTSVTALEKPGSDAGVWSTPIPAAAQRFEVRDGEVPTDAMAAKNGRASLHIPLAPGLKQIAFSYTLASDAFPIAVTTEAPTSVFEVLVEDPRATATGGKLVAVAPVTVEGRSFRRFLAQDIPGDTRIDVDVPSATPAWVRWAVPGVLALVGVGMLGALAWAAGRRRPRARPLAARPRTDDEATRLARRIAALDDAFAAQPSPDDAARATYDRDREALKGRLAAALAARSDSR